MRRPKRKEKKELGGVVGDEGLGASKVGGGGVRMEEGRRRKKKKRKKKKKKKMMMMMKRVRGTWLRKTCQRYLEMQAVSMRTVVKEQPEGQKYRAAQTSDVTDRSGEHVYDEDTEVVMPLKYATDSRC
ncbi:unnamed protein product [Heligmosomoides polygyrus]|uniref:Uncharacterized protein n=1 Tax=Heligmosomoides polygyrus TaxID=6339 RepID=A0A183GFY2_HELPZ|nr:unnamed protein product [Heligmosomoides polygyrus]